LLSEFNNGDRILVVRNNGNYYLSSFDLATHFDDDILLIEKYNPEKVFSAVYFDAEQKYYYLKRFTFEPTEKGYNFVDEENPESKLVLLSGETYPQFKIIFGGKHAKRPPELIDAEQFIAVKSARAKGKRLTTFEVEQIVEIEPLQKEPLSSPEEVNPDPIDEDLEKKIFDDKDATGQIVQTKLF
ncbi:MAG TPA: DNA gyrase/topoisomerase IV subunit A, partial [Bacteroidales bacterium]|nr:DNA gyrase/topoisomerase IV subunit A [Bacteroidales bacterium]